MKKIIISLLLMVNVFAKAEISDTKSAQFFLTENLNRVIFLDGQGQALKSLNQSTAPAVRCQMLNTLFNRVNLKYVSCEIEFATKGCDPGYLFILNTSDSGFENLLGDSQGKNKLVANLLYVNTPFCETISNEE